MLSGYNANSFQPAKKETRKRDKQSSQSKHTCNDLTGQGSGAISNLANTQKLGAHGNEKSLTKQQEFDAILDQMSLNSSSKNPIQNRNKNKENKKQQQGSINLNKSRSGVIPSQNNGNQI